METLTMALRNANFENTRPIFIKMDTNDMPLRPGPHERWIDASCSASVLVKLVMIPVGPHDQRVLQRTLHFRLARSRYNGRQKLCRALQCFTECTGAVHMTVDLTCISDCLCRSFWPQRSVPDDTGIRVFAIRSCICIDEVKI
jgi:hypothetical protein